MICIIAYFDPFLGNNFPRYSVGNCMKGRQMKRRIEEHPIISEFGKGRAVKFLFDGKELEGYEGEPIAAALRAQGVMIHRYTAKRGEPRGIYCAIGRCTDCVMVVDGVPNVKTCMTPLKENMVVQTQKGFSAMVKDGENK